MGNNHSDLRDFSRCKTNDSILSLYASALVSLFFIKQLHSNINEPILCDANLVSHKPSLSFDVISNCLFDEMPLVPIHKRQKVWKRFTIRIASVQYLLEYWIPFLHFVHFKLNNFFLTKNLHFFYIATMSIFIQAWVIVRRYRTIRSSPCPKTRVLK